MARKYYGVAVGEENPADGAIATSAPSKAVYLSVEDTVTEGGVASKNDIMTAIETIKAMVMQDAY